MMHRPGGLAAPLLAMALISSAVPAYADAYVYATASNGQFGILDLKNADISVCGTETTTLVGLAIGPGNVLYGADANGDIYTIDPASGAETFIGYTGFGIANFGYSTNGLYAITGHNSLYSISGTNGNATLIGAMDIFRQEESMVADGQNLYVDNNGTLYTVDTNNAMAQTIGGHKPSLGAMVSAGHRLYGAQTTIKSKKNVETRLYVVYSKTGRVKFKAFIDAGIILGLAHIPSGASNSCR